MEQTWQKPTLKTRINKLSLKAQLNLVLDVNKFMEERVNLYEKIENLERKIHVEKLGN